MLRGIRKMDPVLLYSLSTNQPAFMQYILFLGGILALILGSNINKKLNKYEFENRTDGGVIKFRSFEDETNHKRQRGYAKILFNLGLLGIVVGIIMHFA